MKTFFALLTACALLFTACGSDEEYRIGVIRHLNAVEDTLDKIYEKFDEDDDSRHENRRRIIFNSMIEMTAALKAGQIDEIVTYEVVGNYLAAHNWDFDVTVNKFGLADAFCCAFRERDVALKKEFNEALDGIISDGTLKQLIKTYIIDTAHNDSLPAVEMPTFVNDEFDDNFEPPIRIGVTGDLPPLDYISADGKPAGFNTALLAEISNRLKKNFVLVSIDGGARSVALTSGQVDVVFWVVVPTYDDVPFKKDTEERMTLPDSQCLDEIADFRLKK